MQPILVLGSTVCAVLPMVGFLGAVWWLDRYDREPGWLIGLTFLWGAVPAVVVALVVSVLATVLLGETLAVAGTALGADLGWLVEASTPVLVAPFVEEPAKALILLGLLSSRHFDNTADGFVYGAAAGLGFGMTENLLYFLNASGDLGTWGGTVCVRTFYSAVMHGTASAVVGASLGLARFRGSVALGVVGATGLAVAVAVHAFWNGLITVDEVSGLGGAGFGMNLLIFPLEVAVAFLIFQACLIEESFSLRRELEEEVAEGRMPPQHPAILSSWFRRLRRGWLPAGVDQTAYVRTATELAMRKRQIRQLGHRSTPFYHEEVGRLRARLAGQLAR